MDADKDKKLRRVWEAAVVCLALLFLMLFGTTKERKNIEENDSTVQDSPVISIDKQAKISWETFVNAVHPELFLPLHEELLRDNVYYESQRQQYRMPGQNRTKMLKKSPPNWCMVKIGGTVTIMKIYERDKQLLVRYSLPYANSYAEKSYCKQDTYYFVSIDSFKEMMRIEKKQKTALR